MHVVRRGSGEWLCSLFLLFLNCLIKILLPNLFHLSKMEKLQLSKNGDGFFLNHPVYAVLI